MAWFIKRLTLSENYSQFYLSSVVLISLIFQSVVDASAQRLVNLAQQWEKHRAPLIDQYRELKQLNANRVVIIECMDR